ncbi:MAG: hypothetical protein KF868_08055 [Acidobacteria bacterium]|nr:hypothetical protein [Acidobacteriota bacterium]MCW5970662.1 hypothetical protein [Blastocatellales bacterium]
MITQSDIQELLQLPVQERLRIAQRLIESALQETAGQTAADAGETVNTINQPGLTLKCEPEKIIPFRSLEGLYSGGPGATGERADEILREEIKHGAGFTLKHELPS